VVKRYVTDLTGRQTIYQMIRLAEEVEKRGGEPREPLEYKREFLRRLDERIADRVDGLAKGERRPEEFLVNGSVPFLKALAGRGVRLYCASGTDEPYARREAELLGLSGFFAGGVRGAIDDYKKFSKRDVIRSIIADHALGGEQLACVGDGFVEIEEGAAVGAITVGVASKEDVLLGAGAPPVVDAWKRDRLIAAGADVIVPDLRRHGQLVAYLFGE
jgi:phosphoglycolate phosphatase-like HAD superfamily hydrolase